MTMGLEVQENNTREYKNMNIYFAGSIRGGREDAEWYAHIITLLSDYGNVLTEHIGQASISQEGEKKISDWEIYERDMGWLAEADIVIADVSVPSHGVGYEIAKAEILEKPVICLYRVQEGKPVSAMLSGNSNIQVQYYESLSDIKEIFDEFLFDSHDARLDDAMMS